MMTGSSANLLSRYLKHRVVSLQYQYADSSRAGASSYKALSTSALQDAEKDYDLASEKMMSEGGRSTTSFHEKKEEVKTKDISDTNQPSKSEWQETKDAVADVGVKTIGVSDANQPSQNEWQETKDAVADVGDRAKNKLHHAKDSLSESTDTASNKVKDNLHQIKETANNTIDTAKDRLHQTKESASKTIDMASNKAKHMSDDASDVAGGEKAGHAESLTGKVSEQAKKEMHTSADMVKDMPRKVTETTQGLKEVGVEAAKAVKRDTSRMAEKIGLKAPS